MLTDQRIDQLNVGHRIRDARVMRDESLRECASRLGLGAVELSDAERARLPIERTEAIWRMVEGMVPLESAEGV